MNSMEAQANTMTSSLASLRVLSLGKALQSKPSYRADTLLVGGGIRGIIKPTYLGEYHGENAQD